MKVEFKRTEPTAPEDQVALMKSRIKPREATIFSRLENYDECIAIVPNGTGKQDDLYYWVWLSSSTEDGAFVSGDESQHIDKIAETLVGGGWKYQPNAKIILEQKG